MSAPKAEPETDDLTDLDFTVPCSNLGCEAAAEWQRFFPCGHVPWLVCDPHKQEMVAFLVKTDSEWPMSRNECSVCHTLLTQLNVRWARFEQP